MTTRRVGILRATGVLSFLAPASLCHLMSMADPLQPATADQYRQPLVWPVDVLLPDAVRWGLRCPLGGGHPRGGARPLRTHFDLPPSRSVYP